MKYNYYFILKIFLFILLIISIIFFNSFTKVKYRLGLEEGFVSNIIWPDELVQRFIAYQRTVNLNDHQFDLDILQKQASPEEAEHLLSTGFWPWPDDLKYEYLDKVWQNPIIKFAPSFALDYAMKLYNKTAARELLAWNFKEGQFLLYGANIGVTEGMPKNVNNSIKCVPDKDNNSFSIKKIVYKDMNLWNGYMEYDIQNLKPEEIPEHINGFSFVKTPCDPCVALNSPGNFSCPFRINDKGDDSISWPWKSLWNL
jgi:hypothetical protein